MKLICYLVLAHSDPKHFEKLINAISYNARFFVHIDAKSNIDEFKALTLPQHLIFLEDRIRISWAGISMVDATLKLIEHASNSEEEFSHLVLISGSDYPIKTANFIYETFTNNPDHQFIRYIDMRQSPNYIQQVTRKWFKEPILNSSNKAINFLDKSFRYLLNKLKLRNLCDSSLIPYFGSQWWALTPDCSRYILNFVKQNPDYYKKNKFTFSPDEHFFHTIVGNSAFDEKSDGIQKFEGRGTWRMANFHLIHTSLNKWYTAKDFNKIISSDKLFVRKVNSFVSNELIRLIDEKIKID